MRQNITAKTYHLRHLVDEDRVLLAADISPQHELAMLITRRLLRNLVSALAKMVSDRAAQMGSLRDTILDFEHANSVATAFSQGYIRDENRNPGQLVAPLRLVQEIKVVARKDGGVSLGFDNREHLLTIEVAADRIHMVIKTFLQIAERAGWDFPPIASWLEGSKNVVIPEGHSVN